MCVAIVSPVAECVEEQIIILPCCAFNADVYAPRPIPLVPPTVIAKEVAFVTRQLSAHKSWKT